MSTTPVRSISSSGTCVLDDGREVQLVVAQNGVLGVRAVTRDDLVSGLDQAERPVDKSFFDVSGLDQT